MLACEPCAGRGWIHFMSNEWPIFCRCCEGRGGLTVRQIAKRVRMSPKTIQKIIDLAPVRPSTGLKLIERLAA